jgi:S1-C subfamily serine protease
MLSAVMHRRLLASLVCLLGWLFLDPAARAQDPPAPRPDTRAPAPPGPAPRARTAVAKPKAREAPREAPAAAEVKSPDDACEGKWFTRVYRHSYRSVVRIDTAGGLGAGFLFHSRRHVATAFHVVANGRAIEVTLANQQTFAAEVVAIDRENDLAILELSEPVKRLAPLEPGDTRGIDLGTPVLVIGHPYATADAELEGLLSWSVSQGIISGRGRRLLQTDAAINPGNSGGPLLGCDGRVLGVVSAKLQAEGIGFVIPSHLLVRLARKIGTQPPYLGDWRLSPSAGLLWHGTPREGLLGFELGLGIQIFDRWEVRARYGPLWTVVEADPAPDVFERSRMRHALQLDASYRWMLRSRPFPLYLTLGLGASATQTSTTEIRLAVTKVDPACVDPGCALVAQRVETNDEQWMGYPVLALGVEMFGGLTLSYSFLPDVTDVEQSIHRGYIGLSL